MKISSSAALSPVAISNENKHDLVVSMEKQKPLLIEPSLPTRLLHFHFFQGIAASLMTDIKLTLLYATAKNADQSVIKLKSGSHQITNDMAAFQLPG